MWKVGTLIATLLLILVTTQLWPSGHGRASQKREAQSLGTASQHGCARRILAEWVRDDHIRGGYGHRCYQAALNMISGGDTSCEALYGGGSLCNELQERLRASG